MSPVEGVMVEATKRVAAAAAAAAAVRWVGFAFWRLLLSGDQKRARVRTWQGGMRGEVMRVVARQEQRQQQVHELTQESVWVAAIALLWMMLSAVDVIAVVSRANALVPVARWSLRQLLG